MSLHIEAKSGQIAEHTLLISDPLAARVIAENLLERPICYNHTAGMLGFSGTYKDQLVSVQGIGLGMPSMAIYIQELIEAYHVKKLIHLGQALALCPTRQTGEMILATAAGTQSALVDRKLAQLGLPLSADFRLLSQASEIATQSGIDFQLGNVLSVDAFATVDLVANASQLAQHGVLAVDMETAALYYLAAKYRVCALALLETTGTVSATDQQGSALPQASLLQLAELAFTTLSAD